MKEEAGYDLQAYIQQSFVRQLAASTLPDRAFRRYLVKNYLFLIDFARAYALLGYKLRTLLDIRPAVIALEASETLTYTHQMLDMGQADDLLDLFIALIPCFVAYPKIGHARCAEQRFDALSVILTTATSAAKRLLKNGVNAAPTVLAV